MLTLESYFQSNNGLENIVKPCWKQYTKTSTLPKEAGPKTIWPLPQSITIFVIRKRENYGRDNFPSRLKEDLEALILVIFK